jgi:hypothetical protein
MDQDSMGRFAPPLPRKQWTKSSEKSPTSEAGTDPFTEIQAKQITMRLLAQWPNDKALTSESLRKIKEAEYLENFGGMDAARVLKAVGSAIRNATHGCPSIANIWKEIQDAREAAAHDTSKFSRSQYVPPHGHGPHPDYTDWAARDRSLTREAARVVDAMTPERRRQLGLGSGSFDGLINKIRKDPELISRAFTAAEIASAGRLTGKGFENAED